MINFARRGLHDRRYIGWGVLAALLNAKIGLHPIWVCR